MKTEDLQPQGCTNFKLRQLLRSVSRHYDAQIAQAGLKGSQYSLLSHVLSLGPIAPHELAQRMGMDASTLSRNLRPLIDKAWVEQGPGANARSRSLAITPSGRTKHAEARGHWLQAQRSLNQMLGQAGVVQLHQMIDQVQGRLQAAAADRSAETSDA